MGEGREGEYEGKEVKEQRKRLQRGKGEGKGVSK